MWSEVELVSIRKRMKCQVCLKKRGEFLIGVTDDRASDHRASEVKEWFVLCGKCMRRIFDSEENT